MAYLLMGFGAGAYVRQEYSNTVHHHGLMKQWLHDVLALKNTTYKGLIMDMALRYYATRSSSLYCQMDQDITRYYRVSQSSPNTSQFCWT
jgi:hypothetical protein